MLWNGVCFFRPGALLAANATLMNAQARDSTTPVMHLIRGPLASFDPSLPEVAVPIDRRSLARRLWRAFADDGAEFGAELENRLKHGDVVWADASARYVVRQKPEPLLEISLGIGPDAAAVVGWAVGNLHSAIEVRAGSLFAADDSGLRQTLERLGVRYAQRVAVFQPHRDSDSLAGHGLLRDRTRERIVQLDDDRTRQH